MKNNSTISEYDKLIGNRVYNIRKSKNCPRKIVCKALNITQQQLAKYERGINKISAGKLFEVSRILNVPLMDFYKEKELNKPDIFSLIRVESKDNIALMKNLLDCDLFFENLGDYDTLLTYAIKYNNLKAVQLLLEYGATPSPRDVSYIKEKLENLGKGLNSYQQMMNLIKSDLSIQIKDDIEDAK